ncbi:unnamed protein product [Miscanthus lutarioriparius]|uniref:RRM domain-containing protein n=1 Tax=Miscanthus lutarioriparius TaxID=422564 RepID=A0A811N390_9POAL|nr:unnamed protein product [Miscanthus lutarioriparius]
MDIFASYGPLSAEVAYDRDTGSSKGYGFVQFDDKNSMDNAIQSMNGQQVGGRTISVSEANQRSRRWRA